VTKPFRPILGWEGLYSVSADGEVFSHISVRILKPTPMGQGQYLTVGLHRPGEKKTKFRSIHTLVLETFDRFPVDGEEGNHKDTDKTHNQLSNLEWVPSSKANTEHAARSGKMGRMGPKLTHDQVREIRRRAVQGETAYVIARDYPITHTTLAQVIARRTYKYVD
jgi:hypothetical protein